MPTLVSTPTHVPKPSTAQLPTTMLLPEPLPIRCHYLDTRPNPDACNLNHDTSRCRVQEPTAATASVPTLPTPAMPVPASLVVPMPVAPTPASPQPLAIPSPYYTTHQLSPATLFRDNPTDICLLVTTL
ncbi:unnamed protein product [Ilex paraguariensis]|uniref:Uncharacterized protein n=1 Tax=Ilex paraguariensis TaxID=185542 RepID=A0ABC8T7Q5_9AQUA